ncbi:MULTISPECIES: DUF6049 family protein [Kitasatospora]|uniref:Uncharacterized protein n=1 Tax=Kitasatospora setae (strain ATCC 33774 / DSM 43861 / JCM 3304 / KCC A-0304 / NBRC 14216 / KM-6054) TaxID=452652 RepID=E4MZC5_KITSK|nr:MULTISPECIES: DUF6049 family protein [Kitasatospora]BAJ29699.1 hypothetical protein KSE_39030 [Kitasatospora setae KM-6054]
MDERTGRSAAVAARGGRRTGRPARIAAALLAGGLLGAVCAAPSAASPALAPAAATEYPAVVEIATVAPRTAHDNDTVTITGKITNSGTTKLKSPTVKVRLPQPQARPMRTRSELAMTASRTTPSTLDGTALASPAQDVGDLEPGQSHEFALAPLPVSALKAKDTGTYELAVDVWGSTGGEQPHPLGIGRTYLPYQGKETAQPSQLAVVWPLTHTPVLVAQTMADTDQTPVLRDDTLAAELTGDGRLNQLVEIGSKMHGLTWAVDPNLLDTVFAMTKSYRVQKPGTSGDSASEENTVPGTGRDAATAWLAKLRTVLASSDGQVLSLPYADPDLASIAHNGAGLGGMDTALRKAVTAGQITTEARLSVDASSDVAWPYLGLLDQRTAAVAGAAGGRILLVDGSVLPESDKLSHTPSAARPIGNGQTAVVSDFELASLFQRDLSSESERTLAVQRFLGETLTIAHQEPEHPGGLLVLPPRSLSVGTALALRDSVREAAAGGWLAPATLQKVVEMKADPAANTAVPESYPKEATGNELSADELAATMQLQDGVDQLMMILTEPERVRGPFSAAMVRSMSTEWRDQPKAGTEYRRGVRSYLDNLKSAVRVPKKTVVTLPGDNATLLVSVRNGLTQAVGNLELRMSSAQPNRLRIDYPAQPVVLDAATSRTFHFPAEAQVNGPVQVTAQLWTTGPNARPYGEAVVFTVDVTSVASGVTYVIVGGTVLMLLAGVRFSLQRKKRRAAGEVDEDPERLAGDGAPADADPAAAADDTDRVAGDEKVDH